MADMKNTLFVISRLAMGNHFKLTPLLIINLLKTWKQGPLAVIYGLYRKLVSFPSQTRARTDLKLTPFLLMKLLKIYVTNACSISKIAFYICLHLSEQYR